MLADSLDLLLHGITSSADTALSVTPQFGLNTKPKQEALAPATQQ